MGWLSARPVPADKAQTSVSAAGVPAGRRGHPCLAAGRFHVNADGVDKRTFYTTQQKRIPALPQEGFMFLSGQAKILRQAGLVFSQVLP